MMMQSSVPERWSQNTSSTAIEENDVSGYSSIPLDEQYDEPQKRGYRHRDHFHDNFVDDLFNSLDSEVDQRLTKSFTETNSLPPRISLSRPQTSHSRHQSLDYKPLSSPLRIRSSFFRTHRRSQSTDEENAKPVLPPTVGFWHHGLAKTRKEVLLKYSVTLLKLCVAIVVILSIYWGVLFTVKENMPNITIAVVSFEGIAPYERYEPIVGPFIRAACEADMASRPDHLGYDFRDASEYANDPNNVRLAVFNEDIWGAIIINSNATALLWEAIESGNTTYDPRGAAAIVYNQARDVENYNFHIIPFLNDLAFQVTTSFASSWANRVLTNASLDATVYSRAPQALSPGISFTMLNLRPFDPPGAIPTITIGLIYLIIIAFFSFTFFIPTHMRFIIPNPASPHPALKFVHLIIYRWCATIVAYFFLSLSYSLVSLAFKIPFSHSPPSNSPLNVDGGWIKTEPIFNANPYGHATWLVYFMLNFFGITALGLTCENMAMLLSALSPLPYSALFLIWWVITNVSTGFYALEVASDFYRWGYAWPLRQVVDGSKALVFGTKNRLGLNFGILFVWIVISTALFPIACWVMRWKTIKEKKKAAEAAKRLEGASKS